LNANDLAQFALAEGVEDYDIIKPVEEFWGKVALNGGHDFGASGRIDLLSILEFGDVLEQVLRTKVTSHYDHDVAEIHHVTLAIG
jgi:hypothetical protein